MKKYGDVGQYGPHERPVRRFQRAATYVVGYGANYSYSAATLARLHQVSASAFEQVAERAVRGVPPLRITTGRGISLQLSTQGVRMNARLQARSTLLPQYPADLPVRTYTNSWQEPSGIPKLKQWVDTGPSEIFYEPPASPANSSPALAYSCGIVRIRRHRPKHMFEIIATQGVRVYIWVIRGR